ncbi:MAG: peptidase MA family metallohydrolase [Candidatus Zixiibacteriota bacterium]
MRKPILIAVVILIAGSLTVSAQETYFGKNKVRYKDFDWSFIQTRHFDLYFYEDSYPTAKFAATVMESAYVEITNELDYMLQSRIPVFIYNSHNDFQQTNITPTLLPEGVGGFTEASKKRIVIPFDGSYEDFRHVLHHELTHAVIYDMLFGNLFKSLLTRQRLFNLPLWFAEGYAEYSSRHGWDYFSDMFVRDATINGYLAPPYALGGFLAYKQGQAMIKYIVDTYGKEKLGEVLRSGRTHLTMKRAIKDALGIDEKTFWEQFSKEMKRRYWPEIAVRKEVNEIAKRLTKAREDGSYFNEKPAFSPEGDRIAVFTDKSDYTELVLISATTGKITDRLVKSQRSGDLESLHSFVSGASFSPDGRRLVFVAKSGGKESLYFYDLREKKVYRKRRFDFYNILNPAWSPDGSRIAFAALKAYKRDLYVYDINSDVTTQLTNDRADDKDVTWLANSNGLIFSSDRPHSQSAFSASTDEHTSGVFVYGSYDLFRIDLSSLKVSPLDVGPGANSVPRVSPDGKKVAYVSNRNGIDNIYISYLDSARHYAITDMLTGVRSLTWSPDSKQIAFSAFHRGAFDIFIIKELVPVGDSGGLIPTSFTKGDYSRSETEALAEANKPAASDSTGTSVSLSPSTEYETYAVVPRTEETSAADSAAANPTEPDTSSTAVAQEPESEDIVSKSGVHDGEFVFVSESSSDPLDSLMINFSGDSTEGIYTALEEPEYFDSIPGQLADGEYAVKKYKVKFTPDYLGGGFAYDTFFGVRGQSYFVFSDYLGNHQIFVATDLVNTIDQSRVQAFYFYNRHRTNLGLGLFHTKNFYIDARRNLFSDRFYGMQFSASRPFSTFSRIDLTTSQWFIEREYHDFDDPREDRSSKVTTAELSYVTDNIVWGVTGPINGRRAKINLTQGINLFDSDDIQFSSIEADYRKYWHFAQSYSFAFRVSGGASLGSTPKLYFLGGTTNWIGNRTLDAKVFEVENLYFSDVVTPLRGTEYYELSGNRYGLLNAEFRFPLIDYFAMRFPLAIVLSRVGGAVFMDMGAAWTNDNFKGGTSEGGRNRLQDIHTGFGFGMRANLGFLLLRYDLAWSTDFDTVSDRPTSYFSFGADF